MKKDNDIMLHILKKLYNLRKIGAAHTPLENVPKGFPKHLRGEVKSMTRKLIKHGFITARKHIYGLGVSLNPARLSEVEKLIEEAL